MVGYKPPHPRDYEVHGAHHTTKNRGARIWNIAQRSVYSSFMKRRAFITGITGQDGSYLAEYLVDKGYEVYGLMRRTSLDPMLRLERAMQSGKVKLLYGNLRDAASLAHALKESDPHEIYNLAAQSDVGVSFKIPEETMDVNYYGLGRLINEAVRVNKSVRIFHASTSEMFLRANPPQSETSPFRPTSPYGESKLRAYEDYVRDYRERHNVFVCSGFMYNHESPRRGENFVTRKISRAMAKIKLGLLNNFSLGNLESERDWGYVGDYVRAMHFMLQQKKPGDYVIGTGKSHSVRQFVEAAAKELDMPVTWKGSGLKEVGQWGEKTILAVNKEFYRPDEVNYLLANPSKARRELGWKPKVDFQGLVRMMVRADYESLRHLALRA